jgi:hypothetical protein
VVLQKKLPLNGKKQKKDIKRVKIKADTNEEAAEKFFKGTLNAGQVRGEK